MAERQLSHPEPEGVGASSTRRSAWGAELKEAPARRKADRAFKPQKSEG